MALGILAMPGARAFETDQYTGRLTPLADARVAMNAHVNAALDDAIARWHGPRDEMKLVNRVYWRLGGLHWVDRMERWAMDSPDVQRLEIAKKDSIFAGHKVTQTRVTAFFGVGVSFRLNGVLVGSDKLGHFFSQGRKFWMRWRRSGDEAQAARRSAATERAIFGQLTTGDYSNADLVANYEGHRFHRALFEDGIVPGKPALLRWERGRWVRQREFDWADHVNAYWDEALNPSHFDRWLYPAMKLRFARYCPDYQRDPAAWTLAPDEDARLRARYAFLELRDTRELRLPALCAAQD